MDDFRDQTVEHYKANRQHEETHEELPSSLIESAASNSLNESQTDHRG